MNILIIGNGFDIASNFPTRYIDFLDFINDSKALYDNFFPVIHQRVEDALPQKYDELNNPDIYMRFDWDGIDSIFKSVRDECRQLFLKISKSFSISDSELAEKIFCKSEFRLYNAKLLWMFTKGNIWIKYFSVKREEIGHNWIDFEQELQDVILHLTDDEKYPDKRDILHSLGLEPNSQTDEIFNILYNDFLQLKDYLEIYYLILDQAAELAKSKMFTLLKTQSPDMESLYPERIISLNYTHIYIYLYENAPSISYIHGEVGRHNLVLGIGDEVVPASSNYIRFTKKYQISEYHLPQNYQEWSNYPNTDSFDVTIFGSSVSLLDKGLFEYLFCHPKMRRCTVYYTCDESVIRNNVKKIIKSDMPEEKFVFHKCGT